MTFRRRWGRPITSLTPYSVGDALPRRNACTLTVSDRIQLLGRGPGAVSRGDQGSARDKAFRHLRGCSVVVGYREWPAKLRSGQLLHASRADSFRHPWPISMALAFPCMKASTKWLKCPRVARDCEAAKGRRRRRRGRGIFCVSRNAFWRKSVCNDFFHIT